MKRITKILALSLVLLVGCAFTIPAATGTLESHAAAKVKISKTKATVIKGTTLQLKIKGSKKKAKWTTSKKSVATVNKKGKVTAKKAGKATITAKIGKKKYKCKITVKNPTVKISKTSLTAKTGTSAKLTASTNGKSKRITWKSSNSKIASVTSKGVVYANRAGSATITASANGVSARCKVTVKTPVDPLGSRTNPANPWNGVTVNTEYGQVYFKLQSVYKGAAAIDQLTAMNEWESWKADEYAEYPNTTIMLIKFDVRAVSGYTVSPLTGMDDVLNPYYLFDSSCSKTINTIHGTSMTNDYESQDWTSLKLYNGAHSDMYMILFMPNELNSFSNYIFTKDSSQYWIKYTF